MFGKIIGRYFRKKFQFFLVTQNNPHLTQELAFKRLKNIVNEKITATSYEEFVATTPASTYENYEAQILASMKTKKSDLRFVCLTSGTTGESKYIPYNNHMVKMFTKSQKILGSILATSTKINFSKDRFLAWGSGPIVKKTEFGVPMGYASGYLTVNSPWYAKRRTLPNSAVQSILDFDTKVSALADCAINNKNIKMMMGTSAYITKMLEQLCKIQKTENLQQFWPNLEVVIYGASYIGPYIEKIEKYAGKKLKYIGLFASSEAPLGFEVPQIANYVPGHYLLNLDSVVFGFKRQSGEIVGVSKLVQGELVELLISLPNGFLNYSTTDIVKIISLAPYLIIAPMGRKNVAISVGTEKSTEKHIDDAVIDVIKKTNLNAEHVFVYPGTNGKNNRCYEWVLATDDTFDVDLVANLLDLSMMEVNDLYKSDRFEDQTICSPVVKIMASAPIRQMMSAKSNIGQFKMKKIFKSRQEFEDYLQI